MKNHARNIFCVPALLAILILNLQIANAFAQGTAFTYQGQLQNNGSLASGTYNLQFSLYTNATGSASVAGPVTNSTVVITNGLFTVMIDFGVGVWSGGTNWLQISVESNNATSFTALAPRQELTPVPYAIYALTAGTVAGISVQPNAEGAPNVIAGSPVNFVQSGVVGATISGGGATFYFFGPFTNSVTDDFGTIGGGFANTAGSLAATIAGGEGNTASGSVSTVGGGSVNIASGWASTVAGGQASTAGGLNATVGGGYENTANGSFATVPGGSNNTANGMCSFAAGKFAQAGYDGSFVWSDGTAPTASTTANQFVARANGGFFLYSGFPGVWCQDIVDS